MFNTAKSLMELSDEIVWPNLYKQPSMKMIRHKQVSSRRENNKANRGLKKKEKYASHKKSSKYKSKSKGMSRDRMSGNDDETHHCLDPDSDVLPCAPDDLEDACDKYHGGDFRSCYMACKPAFCCIHDSTSHIFSPSCSQEANCPQYNSCYIVWWKLHDTVGPANYLSVEQVDDFFNMDFDAIQQDLQNDPSFFGQLFGHHFDVDDIPSDDKFVDPNNW